MISIHAETGRPSGAVKINDPSLLIHTGRRKSSLIEALKAGKWAETDTR
jgi:hypothetical protein